MRLIDAEELQAMFNMVSTDLLAKPALAKDAEHIVRACLMVTEMIQDSPTVEPPRWAPVDERLPKIENTFFEYSESLPVLVCCDNLLMLVAWLRYEDGEPLYWSTIEAVLPLEEVTHWMPLPEPPEVLQDEQA